MVLISAAAAAAAAGWEAHHGAGTADKDKMKCAKRGQTYVAYVPMGRRAVSRQSRPPPRRPPIAAFNSDDDALTSRLTHRCWRIRLHVHSLARLLV